MAENYNREVQRAAEHIYTVRSETYLVKKGQAAAILAIAVVILVGLVLQLAGGNFVVRMAGAGTVVGGALVIVIIYAVMRTRGPLNYTTYYYRDKTGTEFLLQVVGRRRMAFSGGGKILTLNGRGFCFLSSAAVELVFGRRFRPLRNYCRQGQKIYRNASVRRADAKSHAVFARRKYRLRGRGRRSHEVF